MNILDVRSDMIDFSTNRVRICVGNICGVTNKELEKKFNLLLDAIYRDSRVKYEDEIELRTERIKNFARIENIDRMDTFTTEEGISISSSATIIIIQRNPAPINITTFFHSLSLYQTMQRIASVEEYIDLNEFIVA